MIGLLLYQKNSCLFSWCKRFHCTLLFVNDTPNKPVIWSRGINCLFLNNSSWPCLSQSFCTVFSFLENEHQKNLSSLNEPVVFPSCNYGPVTTDYMPEQSVHRSGRAAIGLPDNLMTAQLNKHGSYLFPFPFRALVRSALCYTTHKILMILMISKKIYFKNYWLIYYYTITLISNQDKSLMLFSTDLNPVIQLIVKTRYRYRFRSRHQALHKGETRHQITNRPHQDLLQGYQDVLKI